MSDFNKIVIDSNIRNSLSELNNLTINKDKELTYLIYDLGYIYEKT